MRLDVQEAGAADKLFATLDTRIRAADMAQGHQVLLVDTVGFIQGLPHDLVAAFRATLDEALSADVLVRLSVFAYVLWLRRCIHFMDIASA